MTIPTALTIAGSDSGGGAGIQADLKTFLDHKVFGLSVIAAITAQNSRGVTRVDPVPVDGLRAQLDAVFDDFRVDAIKIGMLGSAAHAAVVAEVLEGLSPRPPVVLDPVMVASTGHRLLEPDAERVLVERLLPLAVLATPNLDEVAVLAGARGRDAGMEWAYTLSTAIFMTGGDTESDEIIDVLVQPGAQVRRWTHPRRGDLPFHGTGCTISSAIAARMARGLPLSDAVEGAIGYVQGLIEAVLVHGSVGQGHPSLLHGWSAESLTEER